MIVDMILTRTEILLLGLILSFSMYSFVQSDVSCEAEQIQIIHPSTKRVIGCKKCKYCPIGEGSSVTCGGSVMANTRVLCVPCQPGTSYSTGYSPNACVDCSKCGSHINIARNCTSVSDTDCGYCETGYYMDGATSMCQPCSPCCGDGNDNVIKKCIDDGMSTYQQCSYGRSACPHVTTKKPPKPLPAASKSTPTSKPTEADLLVMSSQNKTGITRNTTGKHNEKNGTDISVSEKSAKSGLALFLGATLGVVFFLVTSIAIVYWCKHRVHNKPEHHDERANAITMQNLQMPPVQNTETPEQHTSV